MQNEIILTVGQSTVIPAHYASWSKGDAEGGPQIWIAEQTVIPVAVQVAPGLSKSPAAKKPALESCGEDDFAAQERNAQKMRVFWAEQAQFKVVLKEDDLAQEAGRLFCAQRLEKLPEDERKLSSAQYLSAAESEALAECIGQARRLAGVYYSS